MGATSDYFTRVLKYMDDNGFKKFVAPESAHPREEADTGFNPGYVARNKDKFPNFASNEPWNISYDPKHDRKDLKYNPVNDSVLSFS